MKQPQLTCRVVVSPGVYADWLANERPADWQRRGDGAAVQRFALVGEYTSRRGGQGQLAGKKVIGVYEGVKV